MKYCKICGREIEDNDLCESCSTMNNSFVGMEKIGTRNLFHHLVKKNIMLNYLN